MTRDEDPRIESGGAPRVGNQIEQVPFQLESVFERLAWLEDHRLMAQRDRVDTEHRFSRLSEHIERLREEFTEERRQRQVESNEECMCRQAETAALRTNLEDVQIILRSAIDMKIIPLNAKVQAELTPSRPSSHSMETFAEEPEDEKAPERLEEDSPRPRHRHEYSSPRQRGPIVSNAAGERGGADAAAMVECLEVRLDSLDVHFHARLAAMDAQVGRRCDDVKAQLLTRLDKSEAFLDRRLEEIKSLGPGPAGFTTADAPALQQLGQSVEQLEGAISCLIRSSTESRAEARKDSAVLRSDCEELARRLQRLEGAAAEPRGPSPGAATRRTSPDRRPLAGRAGAGNAASQLGAAASRGSAGGFRR